MNRDDYVAWNTKRIVDNLRGYRYAYGVENEAYYAEFVAWMSSLHGKELDIATSHLD